MINEDHYDTPWEIKNRAIAAALSQNTASPSTMAAVYASPCCQPRQRMHDNDTGCRALPSTSTSMAFTSGQPKDKRSSMPRDNDAPATMQCARNSTVNVYTDEWSVRRPADVTRLCARHSGKHHKVDSEKLLKHVSAINKVDNRHQQQAKLNTGRSYVSNRYSQCCGNAAYDTPPLFRHLDETPVAAPRRQRRSCDSNGGGVSLICNGEHSPSPLSSSPSDSSFSSMQRHGTTQTINESPASSRRHAASSTDAYPLVCIASRDEQSSRGSCCTAKRVDSAKSAENCERVVSSTRSLLAEADILIHDGMERRDAERLLKPRDVGDYLLRRRPEGNLALSLRSANGILHIKLEMRAGHWVLGEGPQFPTIGAMLSAYHRTELPVRGAEHVRLSTPIVDDAAGIF